MPMHSNTCMRKQKGQALIEFIYLSLAMVPLFLLMPMIGKYQDVSHATQMASRYVALDAIAHNSASSTGNKTPAVISNEVRQRFFGNSEAFIQATDGQTNVLPVNPVWRTPFGQRLIASSADIQITFGDQDKAWPSPTQGYVGASDRKIFNQQNLSGLALADRMGLPSNGMFQANVSVRLANLPNGLSLIEPFNNINLQITRSTVVLHDTWAANNPATVEQRSAELVPVAQGLRDIESELDLLVQGVDMGRAGPRFNRLDRWRDMVPGDRIL